MSVCPRCFGELPQENRAFACQFGRCKKERDEVASSWVGPNAKVELAGFSLQSGSDAAAPACAGCGVTATEVCPTCHEPLLPGWRSANVTTIALVGARQTGKTVYIAVVVKELIRYLTSRGGLRFANEATRRVYKAAYEIRLNEERALPGATPAVDTDESPQQTPLILQIGPGQSEYLVLRDAAGEDFTRYPNSVHLRYLRQADLLLFFLGVERFDVVSRTQGDTLAPSSTNAGDPAPVVEALWEILESARPRMGIVLTKVDKLQEYAEAGDNVLHEIMVNPAMSLRREPEYDKETAKGGYPVLDSAAKDWALLHEEIRSFWKRYEDKALVPHLEDYSPQFFAVSALGHEALTRGEVNPRGISPYRCLDPILWILGIKQVKLGTSNRLSPTTSSLPAAQREPRRPEPPTAPKRGFGWFRRKPK